MRLISPLSIDSILSFTGVIITRENITSYDANKDLKAILELDYSHKSNNITTLTEEGLVKFIQFPEEFDSELSYTDWKIKSILLYRGSIEDGDTTLLAVLNEDKEQDLLSKRFNFRIYFNVKTNLVNISYTGEIKSIPHVSSTNAIIRPLNISHSNLITTKDEAIENNRDQLVSSNLIVKDSNKFINLFEKLDLKNGYEFKLLLPLIVEGTPFLSGIITSVNEGTGSYFSIDFTNKILYIQNFTSDYYGPFIERWIKDFDVIPVPSSKILLGATIIDLNNSTKFDLVRKIEVQINVNSYRKGFLAYSGNSDFISILPSNFRYLINSDSSIYDRYLIDLNSDVSRFNILTDEFFANFNLSQDENFQGVTIINRKSGVLIDSGTSQDKGQESLCFVPTQEDFAVYCKLGAQDYSWHLIKDSEFISGVYGGGKRCIVTLFGDNYVFENLKTLTKV